MNEHHHVGVLFDRPGFPQVAHPRPIVLGDLGLPIQLGEAQHGHLQLPGEPFQSPGDLGHLLLARIGRILRLDQLQVVDHHEAELVAAFQAPRRGRNLGDRAARRVVDEQRRLAQLRRGLDEVFPIFAGEVSGAELVPVDSPSRAEHPLGQLEPGHFQADHQCGHVRFDRHVIGDVGCQRRFSHAGAGGQDHQLGIVQAAGQAVEIGEAGRNSGRAAVLQAVVDVGECVDEHVVHVGHLVGAALVVDGEDSLFRPADQLARIVGRVVGVAENLGAGMDQRPQRGLVADDPRVIGGMGGNGHGLQNLGQKRRASDRLQIAGLAESLDQQGRVEAAALAVHRDHVVVELAVGVGIKILRPQNQRHFIAEHRIKQQASQHAPFGIQVLGWQPVENFGAHARRAVPPVHTSCCRHRSVSTRIRARREEPAQASSSPTVGTTQTLTSESTSWPT